MYIVVVCRSETTGKPEIAGKAFVVRRMNGVELFGSSRGMRVVRDSYANILIILVDPTKRYITVVKKVMAPFW
jgi:hypothetical protein